LSAFDFKDNQLHQAVNVIKKSPRGLFDSRIMNPSHRTGKTMRRYLYFTVFIAGMTTLAAEFGASRLLQNIYGSSNPVWASIIGLIMVYFAVGYRYGGRWGLEYN